MNLSMAYPYVRRECAEGNVARTLISDCSSSGTVRPVEVAAGVRFDLVANIISGSFVRSSETAPVHGP
jgi:hypothetical protein